MRLLFSAEVVRRCLRKGIAMDLLKPHANALDERRSFVTESSFFDIDDLKSILKSLEETGGAKKLLDRRLRDDLKLLFKFLKDDSRVVSLKVLPMALVKRLRTLEKPWFFVPDRHNGFYDAYLITTITYHPEIPELRNKKGEVTRHYSPEQVNVQGVATSRGNESKTSWTFYEETIIGRSLDESLAEVDDAGTRFATEEMMEAYNTQLEYYEGLVRKIGVQLWAWGRASTHDDEDDGWYRSTDGSVNLSIEHDKIKMILDDELEWGSKDKLGAVLPYMQHNWRSFIFKELDWRSSKSAPALIAPSNSGINDPDDEDDSATDDDDENKDDGDEEADVEAENEVIAARQVFSHYPKHFLFYGFNLDKHQYITVDVRQTELYLYNPNVADDLVLNPKVVKVLDALTLTPKSKGDDIIKGKGKGAIIVSSGPAGVGKTLTSEVYSEKLERPLYDVQCSQLGTNPDDIEKNLLEVLRRAKRWDAVLVINEADVYVRVRGNDIIQNAIVGIFLRVLEYFEGTIFLTTNREDIDDAILSRSLVHVRYYLPDGKQRARIWEIMFRQYHLTPISKGLFMRLAEETEEYSGRTIKQVCRVMQPVVGTNKVTMDDFRFVSEFQNGK